MFEYMTELSSVEIKDSAVIEAEGTDGLESLLYHFLDELLFHFSAEYFIPKKITITNFDSENLKINTTLEGEEFDLQKHPQVSLSNVAIQFN